MTRALAFSTWLALPALLLAPAAAARDVEPRPVAALDDARAGADARGLTGADPLYASVEANSACTQDACQMCAFGGTCFTQALAQCRHPACWLLGIAGGLVGAVGGGVVGPLALAPLAMVMYPGLDPIAALFGGIFVGAGMGCVAGGLPGMLCGTVIGESWSLGQMWWPWEPPPAAQPRRGKRRGR